MNHRYPTIIGLMALGLLLTAGCEEKGKAAPAGRIALRSTSYDPTRELYRDINQAFEKWYKEQTGKEISVETDHGPSGKQARDIAAGKETDVAALALEADIDIVARAGFIDKNWRNRPPNRAVAYTSTVAFLVRKGNPRNIRSWEDLGRSDVGVITPDPRTSGGARWVYLGAWIHGLRKAKEAGAADPTAEARKLVTSIYDQAVMDPGARSSTTRFIQQEAGDVLVQWESEVLQIARDPARAGQFEVVHPSESIQIDVPLAVVDAVAARRGNLDAAEKYVAFHFTAAGQEILAKRFSRPSDPAVAAKHAQMFPGIALYRLSDVYKDWDEVAKLHFNSGGELEKMRK